MPKKKEDTEIMEIETKANGKTNELREAMLEVGCKLCQDLMDGKARDEKTALTAIVEIYEAINGGV